MIICILLYFLCGNEIKGVYTNTVHLSPAKVVVVENTSVTLTCSKTNGSLLETRWTYSQIGNQNANLYLYNGKCITTRFLSNSDLFDGICNDNGTYSVLLKRVDRLQHGAIWRCSESIKYSNGVTINVLVPVSSVEITSLENRETIMENTSTTFQCKASASRPVPTISWFLTNPDYPNLIYNETKQSYLLTYNNTGLTEVKSILNYTFNRNFNGWFIYCVAANLPSQNVTSTKNELNISFPPDGKPTITGIKHGGIYLIVENEQGKLSCSVTGGNPVATLKWQCFNSNVSDIRKNRSVTSNVTWTAQRYQHNKSCKCVSKHAFGENTVSVIVAVLYKASVLQFYVGESTEKNSFTVNETDNVTFWCNIESKPQPNVNISHNGKVIHVSDGNNSVAYTRDNIQCNDFGRYICSGMNEYNDGTPSARNLTIYVNCSPRPSPFVELRKRVNGLKDFPATLSFTALAFPEPGPSGFTWYYLNGSNRITLTNSHNVAISSLSLQSRLTIINVTQSNYRPYILRIANPHGVFEQRFILEPYVSSTYSSNVADSSNTGAFLGVGFGTLVTTLFIVGSVLFVYKYMRRRHKNQQSGHNNQCRYTERTASSTKEIEETIEHEQIAMSQAEIKVSAAVNGEAPEENDSTPKYEELDMRQKDRDQYSQLPALYEKTADVTRGRNTDMTIKNTETSRDIQDYINIKI